MVLNMMNYLFDLYNSNLAESQWYMIIFSAMLLPATAVICHFCIGKSGLSPARLFITLNTFLYLGLVYIAWNSFGNISTDNTSVLIIFIFHFAIAVLLPLLYKKGLKVFRIIISILCPIVLTIIFSIIAVAELSMGPERAANYNKNFSLLTQDEKNTFYTQEDLQKETEILFPEFDVIKHSIEVIGPDSGYEYVLQFKSSLSSDIIREIELKVNEGAWIKMKKGYVMPYGDDYEAWGDGLYVYPSERRVHILRNCH
jgi:hypothetical protein